MTRWVAIVLVVAGLAQAADPTPDPRGWTAGTKAAGAPMVLAGPQERPVIAFPKAVLDAVSRPTLLFYFSPTCPHCRRVAGEIEALSKELAAVGAQVVGVASGSSSEAELLEFRATYAIDFPILVDRDHAIQAAMGAQATPSAMLVRPPPDPRSTGSSASRPAVSTSSSASRPVVSDKGKLEAVDVWYPYVPGWDALVLGRVTGDAFAPYTPGRYVGTNACSACHTQEHRSWLLTLHSVAWRTLARDGKDRDPACTPCHVIGASAPGGWTPALGDTRLVDVGCEACHGPGGPHDGQAADPRAACAGCHDEKHAIGFTVERGVPLIDHYAANALDEAAFDAVRRKLYAGEVPQELVAFPIGNNVGSGKCIECHPAEHAWWSGDGHANAMAQLAAEGSADPACVRCHATARRSGPPPTTIDGFDRMGGVGCESCHGPGEAHVAAKGGTSNIQGLGDSCPVCVIDAVCTSCHTPQWSPDWKLEDRLRAVRHVPE